MKPRLVFLLFSAVILLLISVAGVTRGVGASAAYFLYYQTKYGDVGRDVSRGLASCAIAARYYPYNYYFAIWSSENSYYESLRSEHPDSEYLIRATEYWCSYGLRLNPYRSQLRMMKARLLARSDPAAGAEYWGEYVDWHYWEPFNHCALAEFHAKAGDFNKAFLALEVIKGMEYHQEGLRRVNEAWKKEKVMPPLLIR